jgi:hypothetical protein
VRKLAKQRDYGLDHRNVLISAFCRGAVMIADFLQFVDPRRYAGVARPLTRWPRAGTLATIPPFKKL